MLSGFFQNQASTSRTLSSNTIPNPKGEMKAITTRSGVAYEGPSIPTNPSPKKVVECKTEETTDKEQTNFQGTKIPLNENCSTMLLKKLLKKLGDPGKFLIPCDFSGMDVCYALADLGASINFMPLFIWKQLSLLKLTPTRMTIELADRSITRPKGVAEDVFVKVGKFHFPTDFVVVDFEADPRVPLILGRSFLRTGHMLVNRIDVIDVAREEYAQKMLGFSKNSSGGNPTSTFEPIISDSSPSLTLFEGSDFILEEIKVYLKDESISLKIDHANSKEKSSIEEPPKLELKDLPSHLEYANLEGVDKLPVIIAKDLKDDEKEALLKEDYKPAVQSQRQVNPKIHEVIKKEVIKLLDAEMFYPISDSPWVSHIHCLPKKGGITIVENEHNELIPTRLVTGWRVCIDYRKLNDATHKDHFPLLFMDQMLGRLAWNEFYCFFDGFYGYFQIPIDPPDQEKTTFTCPYGTFAYRFGLCNAPGTFQRCMMAIFHDMIEKTMEVFMDDFLVFKDSFSSCLSHLDTKLQCKQDVKPRLLWWVLLLQEFDIIIHDKKRTENLAADHLSRLENPHKDVFE
nr:DNA-directed DNA polymerase [Tanacetum cinerariifolium]